MLLFKKSYNENGIAKFGEIDLNASNGISVKACPESYKESVVEGVKYDEDKVQLQLIDPSFIEGVGLVLTYGASKYSPNNWRKGINFTRIYGAIMRHQNAWLSGEDFDPETGLSHLYHASAGLMFISSLQKKPSKVEKFDDRPCVLEERGDFK